MTFLNMYSLPNYSEYTFSERNKHIFTKSSSKEQALTNNELGSSRFGSDLTKSTSNPLSILSHSSHHSKTNTSPTSSLFYSNGVQGYPISYPAPNPSPPTFNIASSCIISSCKICHNHSSSRLAYLANLIWCFQCTSINTYEMLYLQHHLKGMQYQ